MIICTRIVGFYTIITLGMGLVQSCIQQQSLNIVTMRDKILSPDTTLRDMQGTKLHKP